MAEELFESSWSSGKLLAIVVRAVDGDGGERKRAGLLRRCGGWKDRQLRIGGRHLSDYLRGYLLFLILSGLPTNLCLLSTVVIGGKFQDHSIHKEVHTIAEGTLCGHLTRIMNDAAEQTPLFSRRPPE